MSEACIKHCNSVMGLPNDMWTFKSIIDNIFVFRCREITELLSCVMILKEFLKTHDQVSDKNSSNIKCIAIKHLRISRFNENSFQEMLKNLS